MALIKRALGLKPCNPRWYCAPDQGGDDLRLTYLGTAGFVLTDGRRTVVLDPFVSRPGLRRTLSAPLKPDTQTIERHIPHADDVLVGHSHYDHILDAPDLCRRTGARLIGARATMMVGRAAGVPEAQLYETAGREDIASGDWTLRGLPSLHGKAIAGRVPLPGDIIEPPRWPARVTDLRHGQVLNWWVDTGRLTVVHIDSAEFIREELQGLRADIVCLCAIGRKYRPDYVKEVVELLQPRWIVPCHWDTMITPVDAEPDMIPGVDLPGFMDEIRAAGVTPLLTPILGNLRFPACRHDHRHDATAGPHPA